MHNYTLKKSTHYQGESNIFPNFSFCLFPLLHFVAECQFNCGDKEAGFAPAEKKRNPPSSTSAIHFGEKNRNLCFCIGDDDDDKENDLQSTSGRRFLAAPRGSRCQLCRKLQPLRPQITTRLQKKHNAAKFCQKIRCWPKMNPVNTK